SPGANRVAVWATRRVGEPQTQDQNLPDLRHLVFLDLTQGEYVLADTPYEVKGISSLKGYWSPDNQHYVFQDNNNDLLYVNASTGISSVLDTNLIGIIAWSPVSV